MRVLRKVSIIMLVLTLTMGANLGFDIGIGQPMSAQEMTERTGATYSSYCATAAGFVVGCALMGNALCAGGGLLAYLVMCESGG
jgi:hypothetical protein